MIVTIEEKQITGEREIQFGTDESRTTVIRDHSSVAVWGWSLGQNWRKVLQTWMYSVLSLRLEPSA